MGGECGGGIGDWRECGGGIGDWRECGGGIGDERGMWRGDRGLEGMWRGIGDERGMWRLSWEGGREANRPRWKGGGSGTIHRTLSNAQRDPN